VDEFFTKMNREVRRPKPSDEAVAAALQAIQRLAGEFQAEEDAAAASVSPSAGQEMPPWRGEPCRKCGGVNTDGNRFCGFCGAALDRADASATPASPPMAAGPSHHVYHHHHYHHHYFSGAQSPTGGNAIVDPMAAAAETALVGTTSDLSLNGSAVEADGREPALRQLIEDWASCCNGKRAEEAAAFYWPDALLLRPDTASVRGRSAIERHFGSAFESGLGEVQLEITDLRVLGTIASVTGISLFPAASAKGQERTGKFLILARYEGGQWKIQADVWCLNREPVAAPADAPQAANDPVPAAKTSKHARYRYTW
jgi:uncharacterized protein (TIGR02246 family)